MFYKWAINGHSLPSILLTRMPSGHVYVCLDVFPYTMSHECWVELLNLGHAATYLIRSILLALIHQPLLLTG